MWNTKAGRRVRRCSVALGSGLLVLASPGGARAEVLTGEVSGDRFGESVAWAGDVNGDGVQDFLIGAPGGRGAAGITGTVALYLGLPDGVPASPTLLLEGDVGGDEFGFAVSTAGDVDADGYDDFLVGAPSHDSAGLDAGRTYLFLGGSSPSATPSRSWDGDVSGALFGASLAGGFDFNGDGYRDFAVGAPRSNSGATRAGRVEIYLGSANPATITQPSKFAMNGDFANWGLGHSLDPAGDVNGDRFEDLVAGAPQLFDANSGRVVIWLGQGSTLSAPSRWVLQGEVAADRFGFSVSGAGDRDGDGYDDVLVGAPGHDSQGTDKGAAYVFPGGTTPDPGFDWKTVGATGGDSLGYAVDGGFDLDGDGLPELVAGAPGADDPATSAGEVRLFSGSSHPSRIPDRVFTPTAPQAGFEADDRAGSSVRFIGSANGDAYDDLLIGAPAGNTILGIPAGYVGIIPGDPQVTPVRLLDLSVERTLTGARIRWSLADADELSGLRVQSDRGSGWTPAHPGWLSPAERELEDRVTVVGPVVYRLEGLTRTGSIVILGARSLDEPETRRSGVLARENPFRSQLALVVALPAGPARVAVRDASGRSIRTLWEGEGAGETREFFWDGSDAQGRNVPSGVYFVTLESRTTRTAIKVLRIL